MARRYTKRRSIKHHYSYTIDEAARLLGVSKGSVRRWLSEGLTCLKDQRPFLIMGDDLRAFLDRRAKPKFRCQPHELFCFNCREPRSAAGKLIDYKPRTPRSGQLTALCAMCGTTMHKNFSAAKLPLLTKDHDVSFPQAVPSLSDMSNPRGNDHSGKDTRP